MPAVADVETIRTHFPALDRVHQGCQVAYFDGPGGTQVPRVVTDAVADYLFHHNANTHWAYPTSQETDDALSAARQVFADFLNAAPDEIVFGANMTTLTFHLARALGSAWGPGDEVVVTELDHHANVDPWRRLEKERGVSIRTVRFDVATQALDLDDLDRSLTPRTKLLAIGAASNALGAINDVGPIVVKAHAIGALVYVDAVHFAAHAAPDVRAMGCDFLAFSVYKLYGPHVGVLYGRRALLSSLDAPKLLPASDQPPGRWETGTQNHEGIVGAAAAVDFLASLTTGGSRRRRIERVSAELHHRGHGLCARLWEGLGRIDGVRLFGPPPGKPRTPTVAFDLAGHAPAQVAAGLARRGLFVTHGDFYATTLIRRLGFENEGLIRAGCVAYTTNEEVDRLVDGVRAIAGGKA